MLGRRRLLFLGMKIDSDLISDRKLRQNFISLGIIVVFCPTRLQNHGPLQQKFFFTADVNFDFGFFRYTFFCAKYGNKTPHDRGIHLILLFRQRLLGRNFISRRQRRVRFNFAVVENGFLILKLDRITNRFHIFKNFLYFILFCCCQILGVGTRISHITVLI